MYNLLPPVLNDSNIHHISSKQKQNPNKILRSHSKKNLIPTFDKNDKVQKCGLRKCQLHKCLAPN